MKTALILSIFIGLSYIFIGFLVKKNPNLIAGYNKSGESQRATFPCFLKNTLVTTGILTIIGCSVFYLLRWDIGVIGFLIVPSMLMAIVTLLKENSTKKKKSATVAIAIFALLAILIPIFLILSSREPAILFEDRNVKITGLYGETIPADEIKDAAILENIPAIQLRTNGFSLGTIRKGYFQMEGMGSVKLFLNSPSGPYIRLQTKHKCIILNFKDTAYTNEVYGKLKEL